MRCPGCNKFVAYDETDPEVESIDVDNHGHVTCEVRIVNACADCGTELKEAMFSLEDSPELGDHVGQEHTLAVEENGAERTSRSGNFKNGVFVPAAGRYAKTFYGAAVDYEVTCSCDEEWSVAGTMGDDMAASEMDEMV